MVIIELSNGPISIIKFLMHIMHSRSIYNVSFCRCSLVSNYFIYIPLNGSTSFG